MLNERPLINFQTWKTKQYNSFQFSWIGIKEGENNVCNSIVNCFRIATRNEQTPLWGPINAWLCKRNFASFKDSNWETEVSKHWLMFVKLRTSGRYIHQQKRWVRVNCVYTESSCGVAFSEGHLHETPHVAFWWLTLQDSPDWKDSGVNTGRASALGDTAKRVKIWAKVATFTTCGSHFGQQRMLRHQTFLFFWMF